MVEGYALQSLDTHVLFNNINAFHLALNVSYLLYLFVEGVVYCNVSSSETINPVHVVTEIGTMSIMILYSTTHTHTGPREAQHGRVTSTHSVVLSDKEQCMYHLVLWVGG